MGSTVSSVSSRAAAATSNVQDREIQERGFLQLRSTHDVSLADEHIPQVDKFVADLQEAVNAIRLSPNEGRYKEVHVLLLSWEEDNLGVRREITELQGVLSKLYRFEIHEYEISGDKPGRDTQSRVATFLREHDERDHLLILYYAGHAMPSRQGSEAPIWAATDKPDTPTVSAGGIQAVFEEADSDVLLLYDCCHSAHPAVTISGHGVTEVIAASGFESQAPTAGRDSFTHALIQSLTQACRGPPFSVAKLHEMVLRALKSRTRDHLKDARTGEIWTDPNGNPVLQRHPSSTPVHCFLTEERPHRGIILAPLPAKIQDLDGSDHSRGSSGTSTLPPNSNQSLTGSQTSSATDVSTDPTTNVLLSIRLEKDYFKDEMSENLRTWREWIRNIPPEAKGVKVEAIYDSFSTLVLLTLPVTLWNMLPNNPAYSFVGFVTSENNVSMLEQGADGMTVTDINSKVSSKNELAVFGSAGIEEETGQGIQTLRGMQVAKVRTSTPDFEGKRKYQELVGLQDRTESAKLMSSLAPSVRSSSPEDGRSYRSSRDSGLDTDTQDSSNMFQRGRIRSIQPSIESPPLSPKSDWSATDLVERAEAAWNILWRLPETQANVKIAKLTLIYNIETILNSLKDLSDLEYRASGRLAARHFDLGDVYQDTLIRVASLVEWYLVLAQVVLLQAPRRAAVLEKWSSLTQSLLFDEETSMRSEQNEAKMLQSDLERFVQIAGIKIRLSTKFMRGVGQQDARSRHR